MENKLPRSWKVAIKTASDRCWCSNGLRYATKEACDVAGADLFSRWTAVVAWESQPTDDQPNR